MNTKLLLMGLALLPVSFFAQSGSKSNTEVIDASPDSVLVLFKKDSSAEMRESARSLVYVSNDDLNAEALGYSFSSIASGRLAKLDILGISVSEAVERLSNHTAIEYVEPDYRVSKANYPDYDDYPPNDDYFRQQWALSNIGRTGGTFGVDIDAIKGWSIATGSHDVVVGIIDTGIDYRHEDLYENIWTNPNEIPDDGIDNDSNGYIDDVHGINAILNSGDPMDDNDHGTHVSGILGAMSNNYLGIAGVSHNVSMISCKFLDANGTGLISDAIKCIDYMIGLKNRGVNVRVLNNSWGGEDYSLALKDAITTTQEAKMLFIAAAGNGGINNDITPFYPASYGGKNLISVANTNSDDEIASDSNWGLHSVDMGAPGTDIISTVPSTIPNDRLARHSGTSMAAAHVAGAAAVLISANPDLTEAELKNLIINSGENNTSLKDKTSSGKRLNLYQLLLQGDYKPSYRLYFPKLVKGVNAGELATYEFEIVSVADWQGEVNLSLQSELEGARLSQTTARAGDVVTVTVPTIRGFHTGNYNIVVDAVSEGVTESVTTSLVVNATGLTDFTFHSDVSKDIRDDFIPGVNSIITVPNELTVFAIEASVNISHSDIGDLIVSLTSPQGTTATLHSLEGEGVNGLVKSFSLDNFQGELATGEWTLNVKDVLDGQYGTLNNWSLTVTAASDVTSQAPIARFTSEVSGLNANFTSTSIDINGDIVSWAWDFGDGASSTDVNPLHTYAEAGSYEVTLTVTDSEGQTDTYTQTVVVSDVEVELSVKRSSKASTGTMRVDLSWQTVADRVSIYRNGSLLETVADRGFYRDVKRNAQLPSYEYKVCVTETVCSNPVTVSFD